MIIELKAGLLGFAAGLMGIGGAAVAPGTHKHVVPTTVVVNPSLERQWALAAAGDATRVGALRHAQPD